MGAANAFDSRNRDLAAIHVAKKELGLTDANYRECLLLLTGRASAAELNEADRHRLIEHFRGMGFSRPGRKRNNSANPMHSKIRYLWRDLYRAGAIRDNSDAALDSYVRRMTGTDSLRFLDREQSWRLIEAMKRWLSRF
ncbi:MAG: regulatory protein GemA [Deltaproteobacteria bacterium]|nr:MAG: regulatory protein GemA [Deltaproteobacteria bacterium]